MIKQYKLRFYNFKLVILLTAISLFGVQLVASASPDLRNKQLLGVVMGLVLLVILSLMDYSWILNFQWIMYGFNLLMLIGVRLFGSEAGGASRWLDIGGFRFQPTELSKVIIILFFAILPNAITKPSGNENRRVRKNIFNVSTIPSDILDIIISNGIFAANNIIPVCKVIISSRLS